MSWARLIGPRRSLVLMCPLPVQASLAGPPPPLDEDASPPPSPPGPLSWTRRLGETKIHPPRARRGGPQLRDVGGAPSVHKGRPSGSRAQRDIRPHARTCATSGGDGDRSPRICGMGVMMRRIRGEAGSTKALAAFLSVKQTVSLPRPPPKKLQQHPAPALSHIPSSHPHQAECSAKPHSSFLPGRASASASQPPLARPGQACPPLQQKNQRRRR